MVNGGCLYRGCTINGILPRDLDDHVVFASIYLFAQYTCVESLHLVWLSFVELKH